MKNKFYAGIGSRKTPMHILKLMTDLAKNLQTVEFTLRSGGATGADSAFESGAGNLKQIFYASDATYESMELAKQFHPAWDKLTDYAKQLHARNAFQILGHDLQSPSKFVICWTPDACINHNERTIKTGGTGTAISIASFYKIPVFNLANARTYSTIKGVLKNIVRQTS